MRFTDYLPLHRPRKHHQQGVSLIVVLLFLMAITGIAVLSARKATLGEGAGRNELDMEVARQAAESALRDAERDLSRTAVNSSNASCSRPAVFAFDSTCPAGLCRLSASGLYATSNWSTTTSTNSEPWWPTSKGGRWNDDTTTKPSRTPVGNSSKCASFTGGVPLGTYTGTAAMRGVAIQPEYMIEYFQKKIVGGQETDAYRITARGFGYTRRTQVVLQTVFVAEE